MSDEPTHITPGDDLIFTEEALRAQNGKVVPLVVYDADGQNRRVVGESKMKYVDGRLEMEGHISDPDAAKEIYGAMARMDGFAIWKDPKIERKPDGR